MHDLLNNPVRIQFTDGSVTKYIYSAAGEKLRVTHLTAVPNISVAIGSTRELLPSEVLSADSVDYLLGGSLTLRNGRIDKLQFDEGYCQATAYSGNASQDNFAFHYYDRDHLGSIRQVIKATGSNKGVILQSMNYYPFGAQFCDGSTASEVQSRKYNGKELDKMHGLNTYDYGARQYNPVLGRWDRVDPLCEKYYDVSPYVYCLDNPVKYIDIYGMAPGDRFKNPTQAAIDFGITYNVESIQTNKELASFIYKMKDKNGKTYYTYPGPTKGSKDHVSKEDMKSIDRSKISVDEFIDVVANIHTHGRELGNYENNIFSGEQATPEQNKEWKGEKRRGNVYKRDDISEANRTQTYSYVVTPNGELRGYDPKTGKVTVWSTKMPTSDKETNNTGKTDSNNSIWERFIRFVKSL